MIQSLKSRNIALASSEMATTRFLKRVQFKALRGDSGKPFNKVVGRGADKVFLEPGAVAFDINDIEPGHEAAGDGLFAQSFAVDDARDAFT
ncbi:hypothetical protein AB5I41_19020 [Sphingomonas sp. MMS24-JH45]